MASSMVAGRPWSGHATYRYPNGDMYEGEWKERRRHGYGVCTFRDGDSYEGEWVDDAPHGKGTDTYWAGDGGSGGVYRGVWQNGKRHGCGVFTWPDGSKHLREYHNGELISERVISLGSGASDGQSDSVDHSKELEKVTSMLTESRGVCTRLEDDNKHLKSKLEEFEQARESKQVNEKRVEELMASYEKAVKDLGAMKEELERTKGQLGRLEETHKKTVESISSKKMEPTPGDPETMLLRDELAAERRLRLDLQYQLTDLQHKDISSDKPNLPSEDAQKEVEQLRQSLQQEIQARMAAENRHREELERIYLAFSRQPPEAQDIPHANPDQPTPVQPQPQQQHQQQGHPQPQQQHQHQGHPQPQQQQQLFQHVSAPSQVGRGSLLPDPNESAVAASPAGAVSTNPLQTQSQEGSVHAPGPGHFHSNGIDSPRAHPTDVGFQQSYPNPVTVVVHTNSPSQLSPPAPSTSQHQFSSMRAGALSQAPGAVRNSYLHSSPQAAATHYPQQQYFQRSAALPAHQHHPNAMPENVEARLTDQLALENFEARLADYRRRLREGSLSGMGP